MQVGAHRGQANWKNGIWGREMFIERPSKKNKWLVLKKPRIPQRFSGRSFYGQTFGEGLTMHDFLLIGWWWVNRPMFRESCAQSEVNHPPPCEEGGDLQNNAKELFVYSLRRNRDLAPSLHYCFLTAPLLFLQCPHFPDEYPFKSALWYAESLGVWNHYPTNMKLGSLDPERQKRVSYPVSSTVLFTKFSSVQSLSRVQLCKFIILIKFNLTISFSLFDSVTQLCLTLCNPLDCGTPGFPVHHQLPEFAQTYVHQVGDAIQPSHPLLSLSPPAFNLSQHQGLFQWVSSLHQVAKVLEFQLQHQSFQWIFRTDFL